MGGDISPTDPGFFLNQISVERIFDMGFSVLGSFTFGGSAKFLFEIFLFEFSVEGECQFWVEDFFFEFFLEGFFSDVSAGVLEEVFDF